MFWSIDRLGRSTAAVTITLAELDTEQYDLYAHQNEDIVRLTPEQLKQRMAAKEKVVAS